MTLEQLRRMRLLNQRLSGSASRTAHDTVFALGAVQAQDYRAASWALGVRTPRLTNRTVDRAFDEGRILRTHVLRPTWHFVSPADIRWMIAISAARLRAVAASYHRALGLDERVLEKSRRAIERALGGGQSLTRAELVSALRQAGVPVEGLRPNLLMMDAEANALVCSGPIRGRQFTYTLLDERVPAMPALDRDEAVCALALRYFTSHGPATPRDFAWWAGLSLHEARRGIEANGIALETVEVDGHSFCLAPARAEPRGTRPIVHLLPCFDEYFVAYQHRGLLADAGRDGLTAAALLGYMLVIDGRVAGTWRRAFDAGRVQVEIVPSRRLAADERRAVERAIERLGTFAQLPVDSRIG